MIGSMLVGVLLATVAVVPQAGAQSSSKAAATAPAQDPSEVPWPPEGVFRAEGLRAPAVIHDAKPRYTVEAMRRGIEGLVGVEAIVLPDGRVGPLRIVRSLDREYGLDAEALRAVKEWKFRPGEKDGMAVPVLVSIELTFKLRERR